MRKPGTGCNLTGNWALTATVAELVFRSMKTFTRLIALSTVLLWSQPASAGEATNRPAMSVADITNQIVQLESAWNAAHLGNDANAVEKFCADDITVGVPGMPVINKAGAVGAVRAGRLKFARYETSETSIRVYNGDTAIVTGRLQRTRQMDDILMTDDLRFTKVWVKQADRWQVTAFHASPY